MSHVIKPRTVYLLCHEGSDIGGDVYVGSTSQPLCRRLSKHKSSTKNQLHRYNNNKLHERMKEVGLDEWCIRPLFTLTCNQDTIREFELMWKTKLRADLNTLSPVNKDNEVSDDQKNYRKKNLEQKRYFCDT